MPITVTLMAIQLKKINFCLLLSKRITKIRSSKTGYFERLFMPFIALILPALC
jgi:hypothetical protein